MGLIQGLGFQDLFYIILTYYKKSQKPRGT